MSFQPPIDHGMGFKFSIFARSVNPVRTRFDAARMNGDRPQVPLDPRTNSVAHAWVFHRVIVRPNSTPYNLKVRAITHKMDQLKQFIPLVIAVIFFIGAAYPKPIFLAASRKQHPEQLIMRLCLGALGLLSLWVWYRMIRPH
jgi:hypothetical protein